VGEDGLGMTPVEERWDERWGWWCARACWLATSGVRMSGERGCCAPVTLLPLPRPLAVPLVLPLWAEGRSTLPPLGMLWWARWLAKETGALIAREGRRCCCRCCECNCE
jgi:hypothetical protein